METIFVKELFNSAFSESKAIILRQAIHKAFILNDSIEINFSGVSKFTILFFNISTGYLISTLGSDVYDKKIRLSGLSELGESLYKISYELAIKKYNPEQQDKILEIIKNPEE